MVSAHCVARAAVASGRPEHQGKRRASAGDRCCLLPACPVPSGSVNLLTSHE